MASAANTGQPTFITTACRQLQILVRYVLPDSSGLLQHNQHRRISPEAAANPAPLQAMMRLASAVPRP